MATITLASAIKTARLQAVLNAIDAGSGAAELRLYTAPQPSGGVAITTQTLLIALPLADPAGSISGAALTLTPMLDTLCVASGDLAWARLVDSAGVWCADFDITLAGGGGAITVDRLDVYTGGTIRTLSASLTEP